MPIQPKDIRERLEAIFAAATDDIVTVISAEACALEEADLPAVLVTARNGSGVRTSMDRRTRTRVFQITLFVTQICDDSEEEDFRAYLAGEDALELIPDILAPTFPNLKLQDADGIWDNGLQGLTVAIPVPEPTDTATGYAQWGGERYLAIEYSLPITFNRV